MVARQEDQARPCKGERPMSGDAQEKNEGTTPVRPGFAFDEAALSRWMADHVPGFEGPLSVEQFKGGQSNPTYKLVTPGRSYVLRRKPPGQLLKGAHAVDREVAVLTGLEKASFPVAHVHGLCTDRSEEHTSELQSLMRISYAVF